MDERKFKLKPLDIAAFLLYFGLTPLVLHSLPFFFSCAAEVLLLVAVVLVVGLNHRAEDQEERKRQEDENKKQWNQAMGGDNGPDSEQPDVIPRAQRNEQRGSASKNPGMWPGLTRLLLPSP